MNFITKKISTCLQDQQNWIRYFLNKIFLKKFFFYFFKIKLNKKGNEREKMSHGLSLREQFEKVLSSTPTNVNDMAEDLEEEVAVQNKNDLMTQKKKNKSKAVTHTRKEIDEDEKKPKSKLLIYGAIGGIALLLAYALFFKKGKKSSEEKEKEKEKTKTEAKVYDPFASLVSSSQDKNQRGNENTNPSAASSQAQQLKVEPTFEKIGKGSNHNQKLDKPAFAKNIKSPANVYEKERNEDEAEKPQMTQKSTKNDFVALS
jgi:hypothetical protein